MYSLLAKKGQMIALLIGIAVIAVFLISVLTGLGSAGYGVSDDLNQIMKSNPDADFGFFNPGIGLTVALVVIAAVAAVLFGIFHVLSAPKNSLKSILAFVVVAVIFFLLYQTSVAENSGKLAELVQRFDIADNTSKLISGGLKTTLGLAILAIASMVVLEIINVFK